jgi:capsid protein
LISAVKAGFMSLSEVQRSLGFIPAEVMDELGADLANAREKGLALDVDLAAGGNRAAAEVVEDDPADAP